MRCLAAVAGLGALALWAVGCSGTLQREPLVASGGETVQSARPIYFVSERNNDREIYVMEADGSNETRVTRSPGVDGFPALSPDGRWLAFASERSGRYEVYRAKPNGTAPACLTSSLGQVSSAPAWSPDGSRIAFVSWPGHAMSEIYVMNRNGGGRVRLTHNQSLDGGPVWSPNGARIYFTSNQTGAHEVYVMKADGSGRRRLTTGSGILGKAAVSPDGAYLVYGSSRDEGSLVRYAIATGTVTTIAQGGLGEPCYSPDGGSIAYSSNAAGQMQVMRCRADGKRPRALTNLKSYNAGPSW